MLTLLLLLIPLLVLVHLMLLQPYIPLLLGQRCGRMTWPKLKRLHNVRKMKYVIMIYVISVILLVKIKRLVIINLKLVHGLSPLDVSFNFN